MIWTSKQLQEALDVSVPEGIITGVVQFNSQDIKPGDMFIALTIGVRDGHEFVVDAIARGASAAVVSKAVDGVPANKLIIVEDTLDALNALAYYKRDNSKAKFIAVTGSVGKTSTKEALGIMLAEFGGTFVSRGNFNNYIGVPINLASMPDDIKFAVIEMGMNARFEISQLSQQTSPHIAIITSVAEGHLEFFKSVKEIADAKCEIYEGLDLNRGVAVVPRDISTYERCISNIDRLSLQNIKTFGYYPDSNVRFVSYEIVVNDQVKLKYRVFGKDVEFVMDFVPEHIAANFAACLVVAHELKLNLSLAVEAIKKFQLGMGRGRIIKSSWNQKECTIIADYYNCNPESLKAALTSLAMMKGSNKVAIIGDMGELGVDAEKLHQKMSYYINKSGVKKALLAGELVKSMLPAIDSQIEVKTYDSTDKLIENLDKQLQGGELILIKASRFMKFDKIAKYLGVANAL